MMNDELSSPPFLSPVLVFNCSIHPFTHSPITLFYDSNPTQPRQVSWATISRHLEAQN